MHATYTWTVDGSIIHRVKVRTLPKKAINSVQYLRPRNAMIKFENRITAQYFR